MATILDLGLLESFDFIFPFIIVWAVVFALLQKTKVIGDSPAINAIIGVAVGFTLIISEAFVALVNFITPWFAVVFIFFIMTIMIFRTFGLSEGDITSAAKNKIVYWLLIGVALAIVTAGFATVLGQDLLDLGTDSTEVVNADGTVASDSFDQNVFLSLFHPKMLGLIVVFAIAGFTVALLSGNDM